MHERPDEVEPLGPRHGELAEIGRRTVAHGLVHERRRPVHVAVDEAVGRRALHVERRQRGPHDDVVVGEVGDEPAVVGEVPVCLLLLDLVPVGRPVALDVVGRHGDGMEDAGAGRGAARIGMGFVAAAGQRARRNAAAPQMVEVVEQLAQPVEGEVLQHGRRGDFLAGVILRLLLEIVVGDEQAHRRGVHPLRPLLDRRVETLDEGGEAVRVDGADHRVTSPELLAVGHPQAHGAAALDQHLRHLGIEAELAAIGLDALDQRVSQPAAAADRLRHPVGVDDARHQVDAHAGAQLVGELQVLGDQLQQVDLDPVVLEQVVDDVEGGAAHRVQDLAALVGAVEHGHERAIGQRRRVEAREEHRQHLHAAQGEGAVGLGVLLAEPGDLGAGLVEVLVGDQRLVAGEDAGIGHVRIVVPEPEFAEEPQFILGDQGVALDHDVAARMDVVPVAGGVDLARHHAAAGESLPLQNQHLLAGLRQIGGGGQPVVPRAHDDDVVGSSHDSSFKRRPPPWLPRRLGARHKAKK